MRKKLAALALRMCNCATTVVMEASSSRPCRCQKLKTLMLFYSCSRQLAFSFFFFLFLTCKPHSDVLEKAWLVISQALHALRRLSA